MIKKILDEIKNDNPKVYSSLTYYKSLYSKVVSTLTKKDISTACSNYIKGLEDLGYISQSKGRVIYCWITL